jgi:choice-of-anchor A domain-containing protein
VGSGGGSSIDVGTGGGITIDVPTGGGSSIDVATGGGSSIDMPTGGGSSVDMPTGGGSSVDMPTGGTGSTIDLGCTKTTLTDINVYVIKDATPTGADTEGNMYVGGNLGGTSYSIGAKDSAADCSKNPPYYSLVVGGDIKVSGSLVVKGGAAAYEGTASAGTTTVECGLKHTQVVDFPQLESQVKALSTKMTTLTANGTVSKNASGALVLKGTNKDLNVFNVDGSQLGAVTIDVPLTSTVVVNVSGKVISWPGAKMTLPGPIRDNDDYEFSTHVVWNMYEATSLTIGGIALQGSILAPYATIEAASGGHVAGQVIVEYLKGNTEYHPYYFSGCITWQNV